MKTLIDELVLRASVGDEAVGIQRAIAAAIGSTTDDQLVFLLRCPAVSLARLSDAIKNEALARLLTK